MAGLLIGGLLTCASAVAQAANGSGTRIGDVVVENVWTREARAGENAYVFLTIRNTGREPVRVGAGETGVAAEARLVRFILRGASLRPQIVGPVTIDPDERFTFEPGIAALELLQLNEDLEEGGTLPVTLVFPDVGRIETSAEIDDRTAVRYDDQR